MPKSPEPTTINSVLSDFDRVFYWPAGTEDRRDLLKAFLRSAILKTCDEILGACPEKEALDEARGITQHGRREIYLQNYENGGWNKARRAIESKVKEIKGEV